MTKTSALVNAENPKAWTACILFHCGANSSCLTFTNRTQIESTWTKFAVEASRSNQSHLPSLSSIVNSLNTLSRVAKFYASHTRLNLGDVDTSWPQDRFTPESGWVKQQIRAFLLNWHDDEHRPDRLEEAAVSLFLIEHNETETMWALKSQTLKAKFKTIQLRLGLDDDEVTCDEATSFVVKTMKLFNMTRCSEAGGWNGRKNANLSEHWLEASKSLQRQDVFIVSCLMLLHKSCPSFHVFQTYLMSVLCQAFGYVQGVSHAVRLHVIIDEVCNKL